MTSPQPDRDLTAIAEELSSEVRGVRDDLKAVRAELANVRTWRRRFAIAFASMTLAFVLAAAAAAAAINGEADSNAHIQAVVDCNNAKSRAFVEAGQVRADLSAQQQRALTALFGEVLHVTSSAAFAAEINAYNATAKRLAEHPVPPYPANACR